MNRAAVIFGLILFCSGTAFAAGPARIDGSWYYLNDTGEKTVNAFVALDGVPYYFGEDGALQSDCVVEHEGRRYGLAENGALLRNQWRRFFSAEKDRFCWMYFGFDGRVFENGWLSEKGDRYHFTDGIMDYGWYTEEDGSVFYLGGPDEGKAQKGWFVWKGGDVPGAEAHTPGWYYFSESTGKMMSDRELEIDGAVYAFTEEGTEVSGFCMLNEKGKVTEKYYDPASGKRAAGWLYVEAEQETAGHPEGWYYFLDGIPLRPGFRTVSLSETAGTAAIDGRYYAFDAGGRMITGLVRGSNGKDYFFDADGKMLTGFVCIGYEDGAGVYRMFETDGAAPPALGGSVTGQKGEYVYDQGKRLAAEEDRFALVTAGSGEDRKSYIVAQDGRIRRSGTVCLEDGTRMKITSGNGSYEWTKQ